MSTDQHGYFDSLSVLIRVYVVNHPYLDSITGSPLSSRNPRFSSDKE